MFLASRHLPIEPAPVNRHVNNETIPTSSGRKRRHLPPGAGTKNTTFIFIFISFFFLILKRSRGEDQQQEQKEEEEEEEKPKALLIKKASRIND